MIAQSDRLKNFFNEKANQWIPLPEIIALGIAQYNARIYDLRREGMKIENRIEEINGVKHSWFLFDRGHSLFCLSTQEQRAHIITRVLEVFGSMTLESLAARVEFHDPSDLKPFIDNMVRTGIIEWFRDRLILKIYDQTGQQDFFGSKVSHANIAKYS